MVVAPGASVVSPGEPAENADGSAPLMANGSVSVTGAGVWFVSVTVAVVVRPMASAPKLSAVGDALMPGVTGLARFCGSLAPDLKSLALLLVSTWLPSSPPAFRS